MNKAIIIAGATIGAVVVAGVAAINTNKGSDAIINCKHTPEKIRGFVINYRAKRDAKAAAKAAEAAVKAAAKATAAAARSAENVFFRAAAGAAS